MMKNPTEYYIERALNLGLNEEKSAKHYKRDGDVIDLLPLLPIPGEEFVKRAFPIALLRDPDQNEIAVFKELIASGGNNSVLAYIILNSTEIPAEIQKPNLKQYKKAYRRYLLKRKLKGNRFFRWVHAAAVMPTRAKFYFQQSHLREQDIQKQAFEANEHIIKMQEQNNALQRQVLEMNGKIEYLAQQIYQSKLSMAQLSHTAEEFGRRETAMLGDLQSLVLGKSKLSKTVVSGFPGGATVVQLANCIMSVPSEEWRLAMQLSINEYFEPGTEKFFVSLLRPDMTVVDVGANLGVYTLTALHKGCSVYSFEPAPLTYRFLCDNILMNGFEASDRFHTYNMAAGDQEAQLDFNIYPGLSGHNTLFGEEGVASEIVKVDICILDRKLADLKQIDIVKIDVEGAEPYVLRGMKRIIEQNDNIKILMEFAPTHLKRGGTDPGDFLDEIFEMGLRFEKIGDDSGILEPIEKEELIHGFSTNLLLYKNCAEH